MIWPAPSLICVHKLSNKIHLQGLRKKSIFAWNNYVPFDPLRSLTRPFDETGPTCPHICKQSPCFTTSSAGSHLAADVKGRADILKTASPCPWWVDPPLHPRSILPVQLLQAVSARSNYYVSTPVKEILFVSVTLSSSSELGRSSNGGLISVNDGKMWAWACEEAVIPCRFSKHPHTSGADSMLI